MRFVSFAALAVASLSLLPLACSDTTEYRTDAAPTPPASDGGKGGSSSGKDKDKGNETCASGETQECTCDDGRSGKAPCDSNGAFGACSCTGSTWTAPDSHRDISVSTRSALEAEMHLTASPDGRLAVAWISVSGSGGSDIGYVISSDDGATWTKPLMLTDSDGRESSDPVLAADPDGNVYLTWISFRRQGNSEPSDFVVNVATSKKGSSSFDPPRAIDKFDGGDKPWIATTSSGAILLSYMTGTQGRQPATLVMQRSLDGGSSWKKSTVFAAPADGFANFVVPCVPKNGGKRVWATFLSATSQSVTRHIKWSDDEGITWLTANDVTFGEDSSIEPASCAARGNDVWVAYPKGDLPAGGEEDAKPMDEIRVAHLTNGSTHVDDAKVADSDAPSVLLPDLLVDPASGKLILTYYGGTKQGDPQGHVRRVTSANGSTWSSSGVVSPPMYLTADRANTRWLGDYLGSAVRGGTYYLAYADNSGKVTHTAFLKGPLP